MPALSIPRNAPARVVVLGAGYAGLLAAIRLAGKAGPAAQVTLVNDAPHFVERIRLHQVAAGAVVPRRPLARFLRGSGVELVQGRALEVQPAARRVVVQGEGGRASLRYDALVYALGSGGLATDLDARPPRAVHGLHSEAAAERLARALAALPAGGRVAIVGGGLTAIEGATEIAEARPELRVALFTSGAVASFLSNPARAHVLRALERLGVDAREGSEVRALELGSLVCESGESFPADLVVACTGLRAPSLAGAWGLQTTVAGRLAVDAELRSLSDASVFGAGDGVEIASPGLRHPRMACATALPLGAHVADNVLAALRGEPLEPLRFGFIAQCVSLGREDGVVDLVRADDTPTGRALTGWLGARVKEAICRYTTLAMQVERLLPGSYTWRKAPLGLPAGAPRIARA